MMLLFAGAALAPAAALTQPAPDEIRNAVHDGGPLPEGQSGLTVVTQVLLDRAGISPGIIDGWRGPMSRSAIRAFEAREGLPEDGRLDAEVWAALGGDDRAPVLQDHRVTAGDTDVRGMPLPEDYAELAELDWLGYVRVSEKIAEDYHMAEDLLIALNPGADFVEGERLTVVAPGTAEEHEVVRVEVRKAEGRLAAFDEAGDMVANYPVTVGSDDLPSPSGTHEVVGIAIEPTYAYRPDENFQQGDNDEELTLPPGPNGPVGIVWIDLSKPTYGIHGTSEPAALFQNQSHGCVRMTNWDARELADMVSPGTEVVFR
ncbi:L,D-transpeptidase family protein [Histidinibacterium lentulum]|uniref:Murein L,D-transpeptidase n=1 Tax=Histidinibacterium lentulum TaxID=2480588 RepID=A0A3N2R9N6_9RHOB|nr:L,D-transpeptidase [Histidinibacterium lentulum]ROU04133.1 murein L,D-transpeptidase [Histidinibacterium lentulum]